MKTGKAESEVGGRNQAQSGNTGSPSALLVIMRNEGGN